MITQHRKLAVYATLSAQIGLAVCSAALPFTSAQAASSTINGGLGMSASSYSVYETAGHITLTAQRTGGSQGIVSVSYTTVGGTATAGKQFTPVTGTLTWANGDMANKTFSVPIINGPVYTGTKWFAVRLAAGANSVLGLHTSATINIIGGSAPVTGTAGYIGLTSSNYSVNQSAGSVTITAQRTSGTSGAASVSYTTVNETAAAPQQFTAKTGTLSWASGDGSNKSFTVPVSTVPFTGTKYFAVRLTAGSGTQLGSHTSATVNIVGGSSTTVTKSIRNWVSCNESQDETPQVEAALQSAANHAFTLIVDCPVRFHTAGYVNTNIVVPDGVTLQFEGAGEFLGHGVALNVPHPTQVTFINWNFTFL